MCDDVAMPDRLTSVDASFLYLENARNAMHVGSVMVFEEPAGGVDIGALIDLVAARIDEVPRYRQRVREMPAGLSTPVWIEDGAFDLTYHVRRAALPRPGTRAQLEEFVARIQSRPLDRAHPLWELYVVEGLDEGRFAVVTKSHLALVDGVNALDLGHLLLDETPSPEPHVRVERVPRREPGDLELLTRGVLDLALHPRRLCGRLASGAQDVVRTAGRVLDGVGGIAGTILRTATSPAPESPLNVVTGAARRVRLVEAPLADFTAVRDEAARRAGPGAGHFTTTDAILTVITGALASWLAGRGESMHSGAIVRALVPISVTGGQRPVGLVSDVHAAVVDLPVGEPNPHVRLERIAHQMRRQARPGQAVEAAAIAGFAGFAPATMHHLGARMGGAMSRRLFNVVITNVPGPQQPRYLAGCRLVVGYPVVPLVAGQALSIGLTSYDGTVCIGLAGDRAAMGDLDVVGTCLLEALDQLLLVNEGS